MVDAPDIAKQKQYINLSALSCPIESHLNSPLFGFCIDANCKNPQKFLCNDCIFDNHNGHKIARLKLVDEILNNEKLKSQNLSDSKIAEFIRQIERTFSEETEKIRDSTMETLKKFSIEFLSQTNNDLFEDLKSQKNSNNLEFLNYKQLKDLSFEESSTLTQIILENINKAPEQKDPQNQKINLVENQIEPLKVALQTLNKSIESLISEKLKTFKPETFFHFDFRMFPLEWVEKAYSTYEFYFELTQDNKNACKIKSQGTMTIVRSKEPLELGFCHFIEVVPNWKSGQDFDVGFGNDSVGKLCWLRVPNAYGITTNGIYCNGERKSDICLGDGKKVKFEVNLKEKVQKCKMFLEFEMVWEMTFEEKELFLMAGIRGLKDSIRITNYKKV